MVLPDSPRSDAGFALIEVIVSAVVLAIVALAVLSGIDAANGASTREKARAVASTLAEQDQERMRSMAIDMAESPTQQGSVVVGGVSYTIQSSAQWVTDNIDGRPTCGDKSDQVQYLHITSTVTSAVVGTRIPPVTIDSLVSPTVEKAESQGTLGVRILDRSAIKGVPAITVSAKSATFTAADETTDADGCAVFSALPKGTYTLSVNKPGFLDRNGSQLSTATATVVAKKVASASMTYDRATNAQISVTTNLPGSVYATATAIDSKTDAISALNGASVGWIRTFKPTTGDPFSSIEATGLYPFAENSYTFFTGGCTWASPDTYKPANTNYYTASNSAAALLSDPANFQQPVKVRQPPFNIRVLRGQAGSTTTFADGDIKVFARLLKPSGSTDCSPLPTYELTTKPHPSPLRTDGTTNPLNANHWLSQIGSTYDPGMPFGKYEICLLHKVSSTIKRYKYASGSTYDNTSATGATPELDLPVSGGTWTTVSGTNVTVNKCAFP